jgi:hypothetical protein
MANPAGIIVFFMGFVTERHHLHTRGLLGVYDFGFAGADKNRIRLVTLHARDDFESFNQLLLGGIVTAAAGNRSGIIEFDQGFAVTINAGKMRRQAQ